MGDVEKLECQFKDLSPEELAAFRKWFLAYDWEVWERQLEQDVTAGKLDALAEQVLRDHAAGKSFRI